MTNGRLYMCFLYMSNPLAADGGFARHHLAEWIAISRNAHADDCGMGRDLEDWEAITMEVISELDMRVPDMALVNVRHNAMRDVAKWCACMQVGPTPFCSMMLDIEHPNAAAAQRISFVCYLYVESPYCQAG